MHIIDKIKENLNLEPEILNLLRKLNHMGYQCLVIGGAVRDSIMNIEPKDIDVEVYKISYEGLMDFLSQYGKVDLVGKKFGVIVFNPFNCKMKYDFSIPRKENKLGIGHTDFEITFDIDMKIEEGCIRRDFTMNAIAYDPINEILHDYYGGVEDINNKIIRHTSDKFSEDFLRIIRAMQFQARFDFEIHPDTISLMKEMLTTHNPNAFLFNEFNELSVERVAEEWMKWAEKGVRHDLIFKFMRDTGLIEYYPALKALKSTPQDEIWHPEGDVEIHTELCLAQIDRIVSENNITGTEKVILVMSILLHDIAKPNTTEEQMKNGRMTITSHGHEQLGGVMANEFLSRIGFHESLITPISNIIANHLAGVSIIQITSPSGKVKAVKKLSKRLFPATIKQLLYVMDADTNGRGGTELKEPTGAKEITEIATDLVITDKQYEYILMGRHLIEAGLKPSASFGILLKVSYEAQENGEFSNVDEAKIWLDEYLKKNKLVSFE